MKKFLFLLITVLVVCNILQAADDVKYVAGGAGRVLALGGSPTNSSILDYTDIYMNPAYALMYSDFIYTELGYNFCGYSANQQVAGFTYSILKGLSVGISIGKQEGPAFSSNSYGTQFGISRADDFVAGMNNLASWAGESPGLFNPNVMPRPLQIYGAISLGGLKVGAAIYRVGWSSSDDYTANPSHTKNTIDEVSVGQTGLKAGVIMDFDLLVLDASALLRINSATAKHTAPPPPPGSLSSDGELSANGTELSINGRLFMKFSDKLTLIPMIRFYTFGYDPEIKYAILPTEKLNATPDKYSRNEIELGVGANITVPGGKVFANISFESMSLKTESARFRNATMWLDAPKDSVLQTTKYSNSISTLPKVSLGAEFEITSWLTGRLGYFKAFSTYTSTTEAPSPARKQEYKRSLDYQFFPSYGMSASDQLLSVGLGIHFDRFAFDGYLCEQWLANGPYIISGQGTAMFGVLSMSYSFN